MGGVAAVETDPELRCCPHRPWQRELVRFTFLLGSHRAGDAQVTSLPLHVGRHIKEFGETEVAQRRFRGRAWWNAGEAATLPPSEAVLAPGADGTGRGKPDEGRGRGRGKAKKAGCGSAVPPPVQCHLSWPQRWAPAALWRVSRFLEVLVWRCRVCQRRSRLLPDAFDDYSCAGFKLCLVAGSSPGK